MTDLFAEKAQDWDVNDVVKGISRGIRAALDEHVELDPALHVMDFGAGTGLVTQHLVDKVGRVTAVDVSAAMLAKLIEKPELAGKVESFCQDIIEAPLDSKFDLIVSAMAMHHVRDTDKLVQRFAEHLEPGGRVALADLDTEDGRFHPEDTEGVFHTGFDRGAFAALLEKHGFVDVKLVTAHTAQKEERRYPIFLALARRA